MGRRNTLNLLISAKRMFGIFQTEAEEQVAKNGLFGTAIEPTEFVTPCELARYSLHGGCLPAFLASPRVRTKAFKKLSSAPPVAKAEHVKYSREDR
jgi:hypothetical protein